LTWDKIYLCMYDFQMLHKHDKKIKKTYSQSKSN
jgi:hypothetical protein